LKILQLIQKPQLRGAEIFACQLAVELVAKGHQVDIAYLFHDQHGLQEKFPSLTFIDLGASRSRRLMDVKTYRQLRDVVLSGGYTIVQANAGDTLKYAALSKFFFCWKASLVFRNANLMSGFIRNGLHRWLTRFFLKQCDFVISVSENCLQDICTISPRLAARSATVSIGTYRFDEVKPILRAPDGPVWINIGSFVSEKNHSFLIDLFHEFYKTKNEGRLWLVGDGPLRKLLEEKISGLGLTDRITFWGCSQHAVSILKSADVLVMPSRVEGLPGVILEALSCKIPVIASAVGGIPEVIESDKTGICISGYDPADYLHAVKKILNDRTFRNEITENGYSIALDHYMLPMVAGKFEHLYLKMAQ